MSKPNRNTPTTPYGPVTGIPTPEPKNGLMGIVVTARVDFFFLLSGRG